MRQRPALLEFLEWPARRFLAPRGFAATEFAERFIAAATAKLARRTSAFTRAIVTTRAERTLTATK